jgi:UDP-N-acetylglucosamine 4,6-dehydratase
MHEQMISEEESLRTVYIGSRFVVLPEGTNYNLEKLILKPNPLPKGTAYKSNTNHHWIPANEVRDFFEIFAE